MHMRTGIKTIMLQVIMTLLLSAVAALAWADDKMKPYTLAFSASGDMKEKIEVTKGALTAKGFEVIGEYAPYDNAHVLIITSDALKKEAAANEMGGFGAILRVSVTKVGDKVQVAYTNPVYMAHAYRFKNDNAKIASQIEGALGKVEDFGAKGLSVRKLRKYNYTFGMEYFNNVYELATYGSHQEALNAVEKNLAANSVGISKVYRLDIPGKEETIFGVAMKGDGDENKYYDDKFQMSVVDFDELRQTAYLPYEVMVTGNKVVALHMRFRMAVNFPDLKMMGANSFMTLMPSPAAIEKALIQAVGGKL